MPRPRTVAFQVGLDEASGTGAEEDWLAAKSSACCICRVIPSRRAGSSRTLPTAAWLHSPWLWY